MPRQITLSWIEGEHGYLRPWPELQYPNGKVAARIESDEYYVPWRAACSEHKPISLVIFNHATEPPKEEVVNSTFENMVLAKIWVLKFLSGFEDFIPSETEDDKESFSQSV